MNWLREKLTDVIGLDPRSLAVLRIGLALTLLLDLGIRAMDMRAMYAGDGICSMEDSIRMAGPWGWSLHWMTGDLWFQWLLWGVAVAYAVGMLVGWQTRWMVLFSFVLLASIHTRNPLILNGGDGMFRVMLFWAIFLPLGSVWSLDARRRERKGRPPNLKPVVSVATFCFILQLCLIYWFAGTSKLNEVWLGFDPAEVWKDPGVLSSASFGGDAMQRSMNYDIYAKPLAGILLHAPWLLQLICVGTLVLEILVPFALLSPFGTRWIRMAIVAAFATMHIGVELTLYVGMFSWVALAAWAALLPPMFWDALMARFARLKSWLHVSQGPTVEIIAVSWHALLLRSVVVFSLLFAHLAVKLTWDVEWPVYVSWTICAVVMCMFLPKGISFRDEKLQPNYRLTEKLRQVGFWRRGFEGALSLSCGLLMVITLAWNISYSLEKEVKADVQRPIRRMVNATMLRQRWNMFSKPNVTESWFVYRGQLNNGDVVDVFRNGEPFSMEKPADLSSTYTNHRWRKLHVNLCSSQFKRYRRDIADYVCREWNETHAADQQIVRLEFYQLREKKDAPLECTNTLCLTIVPEPKSPAEDGAGQADGDIAVQLPPDDAQPPY